MRLSVVIQTPEVSGVIPVSLFCGTFEQKLTKAARAGFEGVELMSAVPEELDVASVKASLDHAGLEVVAVGSGAVLSETGLTLLDPDPDRAAQAESRLRGLIRFAQQLEAPLVTIGSFRGWARERGTEARDCLCALLQEETAFAQSRDVRLVLEPLNRYESDLIHTAQEGLDLVRDVGHRALGLLLDTYHMNIEEASWTKPFESTAAAGKLWHIHLGENNRLAPGRGTIDFSAIVGTLHRLQYDGYLSAELLATPDPDTAALDTITSLRSAMEGTL